MAFSITISTQEHSGESYPWQCKPLLLFFLSVFANCHSAHFYPGVECCCIYIYVCLHFRACAITGCAPVFSAWARAWCSRSHPFEGCCVCQRPRVRVRHRSQTCTMLPSSSTFCDPNRKTHDAAAIQTDRTMVSCWCCCVFGTPVDYTEMKLSNVQNWSIILQICCEACIKTKGRAIFLHICYTTHVMCYCFSYDAKCALKVMPVCSTTFSSFLFSSVSLTISVSLYGLLLLQSWEMLAIQITVGIQLTMQTDRRKCKGQVKSSQIL